MRHPSFAIPFIVLLGLGLAGSAAAQGKIELTTTATQEVRALDEQGNEVVTVAPAGKVVPGTVVIYTIEAKNISDQPVNAVVINDPIPAHMTYVDDSAEGADTEIVFSVDGGSSFAAAGDLRVTDEAGVSRAATAKDYTHVRWTLLGELAPKQTRSVSFRARLD